MKISVVINNYNYANYISETLQSVLDQEYAAHEIIIVDDGSIDGSVAIVEEFAKIDQRVQLCVQENQGQLMALLNGLRRATGDIICLLDADDIFYPNHLTEVVATFKEHSKLGMRFNDVEAFSFDGIKERSGHVKYYGDMGVTCIAQFLLKSFLGNVTSSLSLSKDAVSKMVRYMDVYPYKEDWRLRADNCFIWLVSLFGMTKYNSDKMTVGYRVHDNNGFEGKEICIRQQMEYQIIKSRFFEISAIRLGITRDLLSHVQMEYLNSPIKHKARFHLYRRCMKRAHSNKITRFRKYLKLYKAHRRMGR